MGLPTPSLTWAAVYVDVGSGPVYWGLYSMIEDPQDVMMKTWDWGTKGPDLLKGKGNLYKPEHSTWVSQHALYPIYLAY